MINVQKDAYVLNNYSQAIALDLTTYTERFDKGSSVEYKVIDNDYFLTSNRWSVDFVGNIEQFKDKYKEYKHRRTHLVFDLNNETPNLELKYVFYTKLFKEEWSFNNVFKYQKYIKLLTEFINNKYPRLMSLLDINANIDSVEVQWRDWLVAEGKNLTLNKETKSNGKTYEISTPEVTFLRRICNYLYVITDIREEWEKDKWDVRKLKEKYAINFSNSRTQYYMNFEIIENAEIRKQVKAYFKERLLSGKGFNWNTATAYFTMLNKFFDFINETEPKWNSLNLLERKHILKFIEYLRIHCSTFTHRNSNPNQYISMALSKLYMFLYDIQSKQYSIAPRQNVNILVQRDDKPQFMKKSVDDISYIPDSVLSQLFDNINELSEKVQIVLWIMYKTGLRISDTLELKQDCLKRLNSKYWVVTDIEKTYVKGHRIPIDDDLANMLAVLISNAEKTSNTDNNPDNYIFVKYNGVRKGRPYTTTWAINELNAFARKINIVDEDGNVYHFKKHAFRHTYAVKLLNGGADILTVQELLAHASPEMTMRYAKLLDDTKRRAFDSAVSEGVFSFDIDGCLHEEIKEAIPNEILDMLWTNHKLNAIDTPYGTCMQRSKGKCTFSKQPPCLTCNGGKPCKDLGIGIFEGDGKKYEIHITSTKALIEQAEIFNRKDMADENKQLLRLYEEIYGTIKSGNIVYGRVERLKKQGDANE